IRVLVALGGSATVDGGSGLARALGMRFLDAEGNDLSEGGGSLERLAHIDLSRLDPRVRATPLVACVDVVNPLLGPQGAAAVFGPQKGASPEQVEVLDRGLQRLGARLAADLGADVASMPVGGAASAPDEAAEGPEALSAAMVRSLAGSRAGRD